MNLSNIPRGPSVPYVSTMGNMQMAPTMGVFGDKVSVGDILSVYKKPMTYVIMGVLYLAARGLHQPKKNSALIAAVAPPAFVALAVGALTI